MGLESRFAGVGGVVGADRVAVAVDDAITEAIADSVADGITVPASVEPEAVEPEAVEPEAVEPEAVEPEAVPASVLPDGVKAQIVGDNALSFLKVIKAMAISASTDAKLPTLTHINVVDGGAGTILLYSTDRYRLARIRFEAVLVGNVDGILIPTGKDFLAELTVKIMILSKIKAPVGFVLNVRRNFELADIVFLDNLAGPLAYEVPPYSEYPPVEDWFTDKVDPVGQINFSPKYLADYANALKLVSSVSFPALTMRFNGDSRAARLSVRSDCLIDDVIGWDGMLMPLREPLREPY